MKVDIAKPDDHDMIMSLCYRFYTESGTKINWNTAKAEAVVAKAIEDRANYLMLTLKDDEQWVVGVLGAEIITPHFSNDRVAMEWLWYVDPSYRSSKSIQLLKAYLYWAFDVMKCDHATMSTLDGELADKLHKLYTKIGFSKQENTYIIGRAT